MYAGHLGFALGAASFRRTVPLWLLLIAAQIPDWLDVGICSADMDRGPAALYTHGIPITVTLAFTIAFVYAAVRSDVWGGVLVAITVLSHYALDFLTGIKPTWAGGPIVGLQLYSVPVADMILEGSMILAGWYLYRRSLPEARRGTWPVYGILATLLFFQALAGLSLYFNLTGGMKC